MDRVLGKTDNVEDRFLLPRRTPVQCAALGVGIDVKNRLPGKGRTCRQVGRQRCLSDAALLVQQSNGGQVVSRICGKSQDRFYGNTGFTAQGNW